MTAPSLWFAQGLRFSCRRCGACCTGEPGFVFVHPRETALLAAHVGLDVAEVAARFTRPAPGGRSLVELADGRCVFYEEGCRVYPVRPRQCRAYPFWARILASPETWEGERGRCPGMGTGEVHGVEAIAALLGATPREPAAASGGRVARRP